MSFPPNAHNREVVGTNAGYASLDRHLIQGRIELGETRPAKPLPGPYAGVMVASIARLRHRHPGGTCLRALASHRLPYGRFLKMTTAAGRRIRTQVAKCQIIGSTDG
jgi:hypothetical protein